MSLFLVFVMLVFIPIISVIDVALFSRWSKCDKCGDVPSSWKHFVLPCLAETFCFLCGWLAAGGT